MKALASYPAGRGIVAKATQHLKKIKKDMQTADKFANLWAKHTTNNLGEIECMLADVGVETAKTIVKPEALVKIRVSVVRDAFSNFLSLDFGAGDAWSEGIASFLTELQMLSGCARLFGLHDSTMAIVDHFKALYRLVSVFQDLHQAVKDEGNISVISACGVLKGIKTMATPNSLESKVIKEALGEKQANITINKLNSFLTTSPGVKCVELCKSQAKSTLNAVRTLVTDGLKSTTEVKPQDKTCMSRLAAIELSDA